MEPSLKHEAIRKLIDTSIRSFGPAVPSVNHVRGLLEVVTALRTLPWGIHFTKVQFGSVSGEFVRPDDVHEDIIMLYLHGGGYSIGSSKTHRSLVGTIAQKAEITVFMINYRKAPEHPFPAALNDTVDAYQVLLKSYKPRNIIIAGDSAGGGLALSLQHVCKQRNLPMPGATICLSPWVDLVDMSGTVQTNEDKDPFVDIRKMRYWAESYAGEYHLTHSLVSPIYGKFEGFRPILIQASKGEMLYDNARKLARKAELETDVVFQVWTGLMHWWHLFTGIVPEADEAVEKIAKFIQCRYDI